MGRENDEDFREFVATRSPALLRTAYLLTGDRGLAEDLVQSALTRAYRHWARVRTAGSPEAYVRTILLNEQRRWWRKPSSREVLAGERPERPGRDEPAAVDERDRLWRIRVAVSKDGREIYSLNVGTRTTQPRRPSHEELATSLERAPGDGDWPIAVELIQQQWHLVPVDQSDPRVLWSGRTASGHTVVVATTALPSGAGYVWGAAESATPGPFFPFDGLLGSGKLDDTALVIRMRVAGNATAVVFTGTHRVHAGGRTTTATGGLIVEGGGPVEVDGLQTVDVTDLPHFPGPAL